MSLSNEFTTLLITAIAGGSFGYLLGYFKGYRVRHTRALVEQRADKEVLAIKVAEAERRGMVMEAERAKRESENVWLTKDDLKGK